MQLWFLLNKKENKALVLPYLSDRLLVERYSPTFFLPLMGSGILTMLLLFFLTLLFFLLYIVLFLVLLMLIMILLYDYKKHKIIKEYYDKINKGDE